MSKIINDKKVKKHIIKPYKFKPLEDSSEIKEDFVVFSKEPENEVIKDEEKEIPTNNEVIENLLKKIEELSNNIMNSQLKFEEEIKKTNIECQSKIKEAFEDGYKNAKEECEVEYQNRLQQLQLLYQDSIKKLEEITQIFNKKIEEIEKELVAVALDIAEEILQKEVKEDSKNVALSLAKSLLNDIKEASKVTIKVNPEDAEYIKENIKDIEVIPDNAVKKGGIVILSDVGNIDGEIEERFKNVKEAILNKGD